MFAPEDGWVVKASFVAAPGEFVSLKLALLAPVAPALTVYDPATVFAVKVVEVACPLLALVPSWWWSNWRRFRMRRWTAR